MGSNKSRVPTELPHLVVVGGSFAGISICLNTNMNFRITVIEKKEFFEWATAVPYSVVSKDYFETGATIDYNQMINVDKVLGVNVTYEQAVMTELVDENTLKISKINGADLENSEETIKFDYLVLCTGSIYSLNDKPEDIYKIYNKKKRADLFSKYRNEIDKANSVLVVGGGATGLEAAGCLLMTYQDKKKIGIVNGGSALLSGFPAEASKAALDYFESKGVQVYLNTKFSDNSKLAEEYDFVWKCAGINFYTPFMDKNFKD